MELVVVRIFIEVEACCANATCLHKIGPILRRKAAEITSNSIAVQIQPASFEELFTEQLKKYDKFREMITTEEKKQEKLLKCIRVCITYYCIIYNAVFIVCIIHTACL